MLTVNNLTTHTSSAVQNSSTMCKTPLESGFDMGKTVKTSVVTGKDMQSASCQNQVASAATECHVHQRAAGKPVSIQYIGSKTKEHTLKSASQPFCPARDAARFWT